MPHAANDLLPDEPAARRLLLARALDEADPHGRLVGAAEKQQAEDDALRESAAGAGAAPEPLAWLQARAARIAALLDHRSPALAALAHGSGWQSHAAWVLPLAALAAGAFIDRIDNPRQVNLLSPPLVAFLLWNLGVYLLLAVHAAWPRRVRGAPAGFHWPWRTAGPAAVVAAAFQRHWWSLGGALQSQRWRRILHASAAAWGLGVAVSIVLGGIVREYRVGWESTLLEPAQVHAVLRWMFGLPAALLGTEPFSMAEVARLHFGSGEAVARAEARRWVALYLGLIAIVVVVPRTLLAAWAAWRARQAAHDLRVDLDDPYYAALLSRVTPARVRIGVDAPPGPPRERLWLALQQAGGLPPGGEPWTVLATDRGDMLQVVSAVAARAAPAETASWWKRSAAAPAPRLPYDLLLVAREADAGVARDDAVRAAAAAGVPVVALGPSNGAARITVPWEDLPTWREDARLWAALAQACPAHQRAGIHRLWKRAQEHAAQRLRTSVRLLAEELVQDAQDTEPLPAPAVGMRQLLVREDRDAADRAGGEATSRLLARVHERQARNDERLLALHGLDPATVQREAVAAAVRLQRAVDAPQAGFAGAASGAAVGAGIDLVTGGLTLGAASALGALVGGGAAMAAAAWRNARGEAGASSVMLDDAALPVLVRAALLRYLAVAHAGRARMDGAQARIAAVEAEDVDGIVRCLRGQGPADGGTHTVEAQLQLRLERLLQRLHGDHPTPDR